MQGLGSSYLYLLSWAYLGITLLLLSARTHHNLQLRLVQRHQAQVETGEEAAETEKDTEEEDAGPGW